MLLFMKVLFTQFIAEMGDKTQLMLVANDFQVQAEGYFAWNRCCCPGAQRTGSACRRYYQYRGPYLADPSDRRCSVSVFAVTTLKGDDDEEENVKDRKIKFAPLSVFCTFLLRSWGIRHSLPQLHLVPMRD